MKIIALICSLLLYCGDSLAEDFSFPEWLKTDMGTRLHHDGAKSVWESHQKALGSTGFKASAGYCKYVDRDGKYPDYYSIEIEYAVEKGSLVCFQRDISIKDLPGDFEDSVDKIVSYDEKTREVTIVVGKNKWKYTLPVPK